MDATQQKGSPKQLRGRSLGTKLSEAEYAQCEKSAARRGQTLSEGCCQVLREAAACSAQVPEAEGSGSDVNLLYKPGGMIHASAARWCTVLALLP